jgi:hypothetical protein
MAGQTRFFVTLVEKGTGKQRTATCTIEGEMLLPKKDDVVLLGGGLATTVNRYTIAPGKRTVVVDCKTHEVNNLDEACNKIMEGYWVDAAYGATKVEPPIKAGEEVMTHAPDELYDQVWCVVERVNMKTGELRLVVKRPKPPYIVGDILSVNPDQVRKIEDK